MKTILVFVMAAIALLIFPPTARSVELLTNGSFETGNFTGWTFTNASGSWMNWQVSGAGAGGGFNPPYPSQPQSGTRSAWNGVTANASQVYTLHQDVAIPAVGTTSLSWMDRFQMNLADFCNSAAACGQAFFVVDIQNSAGTAVLETLYSVTAPPLAYTDTGWLLHQKLMTAYAGQTVRLRFRSWATVTLAGPGQAEIDSVSVQSPATASLVAVSGRVRSSSGMGVSGTSITLTDTAGRTTHARTNAFGYYRFDDIRAGETYVVTANHKQYLFANNPRLVIIDDELLDLDFVASP